MQLSVGMVYCHNNHDVFSTYTETDSILTLTWLNRSKESYMDSLAWRPLFCQLILYRLQGCIHSV